MKTVSIADFRKQFDQYLAAVGDEDIVLLSDDGNPCALLQAIPADADPHAASFARSPEFWQMIHQRRQEEAIPWDEAKEQLTFD
jgi:antitoxin (DNA-binding transcriptional repressor) of toxin-antitoxin stability system